MNRSESLLAASREVGNLKPFPSTGGARPVAIGLFGVPLPSRCLSPQPGPEPAQFQAGARVVWSEDGEEGTLLHVSCEAITVRWDESGVVVYGRCTFAARERVVVLATSTREGWL